MGHYHGMSVILGLDVSTSCTGICVVNSDIQLDEKGSHILLLDRIEFKGCNTLWEKADRVDQAIKQIESDMYVKTRRVPAIDRVVLEEPLMGFRPGMSSAQTITQLMRFNGVVSYLARNRTKCEPEYIGSAHARKLCGIKLQRTALGGPQKEQVFAHMAANDLKHVAWPVTKTGKVVPWSRDATDAYVIARAAAVEGTLQPSAKKSKNTGLSCVQQDCDKKPLKGLTMCRKHQPLPA